ncbi:MAG: ABC transporter substrate-binding protein, partial [Chloroflexota bacterium]
MKHKERRIGIVMAVLASLSLLLASCAPAAAPAPTKAPAAAPTKAPAAAPTAPAAPAATKAPAAARTEPKPAAPTPTPKPAAEQPKYGGVLNASMRGEPRHFDFQTESSQSNVWPFSPAYSGIVQNDPLNPGNIVPDLAESWTVSSDGSSYTFKLRKGVKWHDGNPLTASDVLLSLERLKKNTQVGPGLGPVKSMETPDEHTIKVVMSYPSAALLSFLAIGWAGVIPKHIFDKKGHMKDDVVGTGAFKFKRHNRGVVLDLARNAEYFIPGRPYLDGISVYFIADPASASAALRTGRLHFLMEVSTTSANRLMEAFKEVKLGDC